MPLMMAALKNLRSTLTDIFHTFVMLMMSCYSREVLRLGIQQVLSQFESCSGLKVNGSQSLVIFSGTGNRLKRKILDILGYSESHLPLRYLGLPLSVQGLLLN